MRFLKDVPRRFRNGFRTVNNFSEALNRNVQATNVLKKQKVPKRKLK